MNNYDDATAVHAKVITERLDDVSRMYAYCFDMPKGKAKAEFLRVHKIPVDVYWKLCQLAKSLK